MNREQPHRTTSPPIEFRQRLESHLSQRPNREDLLSHNIIKTPNNVAPQIQTSMLKVQKHLRRAELDALLRQRVDLQLALDSAPPPLSPARHKAKSQHVPPMSSLVAPALSSGTLQRLSKTRRETTLTTFLESRPNIQQLQHRRVIFEDTMVWTREQCTGAIPTPRNCHSLTAVHCLDTLPAASSSPTPQEMSECSDAALVKQSADELSSVDDADKPAEASDNDVMYLFGGFGTDRANELWMLDCRSRQRPGKSAPEYRSMQWSRPLVAGTLPVDRYSHTLSCVGANRTQLLLFGGFSSTGQWLNDVHVLDTAHKQTFLPIDPFGHEAQPQSLLFWFQPVVRGVPPAPRAAHSATVVDSRVFVFGGNDGSSLFNDLHILDTQSMSWSQPLTSGQPPLPRAGHSALLVGDYIVVFGGQGVVFFNDLHLLHVPTLTWTQPMIRGTAPSPRAGHSCCELNRNRLLLFGGSCGTKVMNDVCMLDLDEGYWRRPADSGALPLPRAGHACARADQSRLVFFGGGDVDGAVYSDVHVLDTTFFILPQAHEESDSAAVASNSNEVEAETPTDTGRSILSHMQANDSKPARRRSSDLSASAPAFVYPSPKLAPVAPQVKITSVSTAAASQQLALLYDTWSQRWSSIQAEVSAVRTEHSMALATLESVTAMMMTATQSVQALASRSAMLERTVHQLSQQHRADIVAVQLQLRAQSIEMNESAQCTKAADIRIPEQPLESKPESATAVLQDSASSLKEVVPERHEPVPSELKSSIPPPAVAASDNVHLSQSTPSTSNISPKADNLQIKNSSPSPAKPAATSVWAARPTKVESQSTNAASKSQEVSTKASITPPITVKDSVTTSPADATSKGKSGVWANKGVAAPTAASASSTASLSLKSAANSASTSKAAPTTTPPTVTTPEKSPKLAAVKPAEVKPAAATVWSKRPSVVTAAGGKLQASVASSAPPSSVAEKVEPPVREATVEAVADDGWSVVNQHKPSRVPSKPDRKYK